MNPLQPFYKDDRDDDDDSHPDEDADQGVAADFEELPYKTSHADKPRVDQCVEILQGIKSDLSAGRKLTDLVDCYRHKLEDCPPGGGDEPTVLHWTVKRYQYHSDEGELRATEAMMKVVLEAKPEFLERQNKDKKTPLHLVFESDDLKMRQLGVSLAEIMCEYGSVCREAAGRAIALPDKNGETCVHLAITGGWEIATKLIRIAEESAFKQQRNTSDEGKKVAEGGGNTPLHDAVAYHRCVFTTSRCRKKGDKRPRACRDCKAVKKKYEEDSRRVDGMIRLLVQKYDKALTIKNADDESPYLHLLRTRKDCKAAQSKSSTSSSSSTNASALTTKPGQGTSGKATPQPVDESRLAAPPHSKSNPSELLLQTQLAAHGPCETIQVDNERLAEVIEKHLVESAFAIGGFEDACACFFGDDAVKDGKHAPFRPGYPIFAKSHKVYSEIVRPGTRILPHVHLEVGSFVSEETEPEKAALDEERRERRERRRQQIENDWRDHMDYLTKVFEMLKERGVKQILKVTVKDNPDRPCRDKVIIKCLSGFDVRYLDWQTNDLCIDVVLAAAPRVSELTLYSSGNTAVLRGWAASYGLCSLNQLTILRLVAHMGLEEIYEDYVTNVNSFVTVVTENIAMTRWKVLLKAEKQLKDSTRMASKPNTQGVSSAAKRPQHSQQRQDGGGEENLRLGGQSAGVQGQANPSGGGRNNAQTVEKEEVKEEEEQEDETRQLGQLQAKWDSLEERRKPREATTSHTGGAEATDAQSGPETGEVTAEFLRLDSQRSDKVFLTSDGIQYAAWNFTFKPPVLDPDPLPKKNAKTDILNNALKQQSAGTAAPGLAAPDETMNTWLHTVSSFLEKNLEATGEVKVALIDDGVDIRQFDGQIHHEGWPYVSFASDKDRWFKSTNEHGTRMAQLILKVCPRAKLYVAKLADWKRTEQKSKLAEHETAKSAAEAVKWARQKNVQIISMSWCLVQDKHNKEAIDELEDQIRKAASENIIMFCAAADKGRYEDGQRLYPKDSDTQRLMVVGSAKENGEPSEFVDPEQAKVLFPGENIEELGESKGSSAATALASGLTALILWCLEKEKKPLTSGHADRIFKLFGNLKPDRSNWVNVHKLLKYGGDIQSVKKVAELCINWSTT